MDPVGVPSVDLICQHRVLERELSEAFIEVLRGGSYVLGRAVGELEAELARVVGRQWVVGVSSGTDALLCALMALGVGPGDEVVTTPFTFIATATAIVRLGAAPVFVDIEPSTFNLDPQLVPFALTPRTRAVIAVHLFGNPVDVDALAQRAPGIPVVEDAAQALGATWHGRPVGSLGALGCFSFFPTKPLGGLGDGGAVCCESEELERRCRSLRSHGASRKYWHELLGGNFRLDELQAALLRVKLPHLGEWNVARRRLAQRYAENLSGLASLRCPEVRDGAEPVYAQYAVRVSEGRRDALADHLTSRGIAVATHYPTPLYAQPCLAPLCSAIAERFPETERASREVMSLPLYPELSEAQQDRVVDEIWSFLDG